MQCAIIDIFIYLFFLLKAYKQTFLLLLLLLYKNTSTQNITSLFSYSFCLNHSFPCFLIRCVHACSSSNKRNLK